jgi:ABC-type multidrug transport system ATPase subunit
MTVISVRHLTKQYKDVLAVDGISFDIEKGGITALLGCRCCVSS